LQQQQQQQQLLVGELEIDQTPACELVVLVIAPLYVQYSLEWVCFFQVKAET